MPCLYAAEQMSAFRAQLPIAHDRVVALTVGDDRRALHGGLVLELMKSCPGLKRALLYNVDSLMWAELVDCQSEPAEWHLS